MASVYPSGLDNFSTNRNNSTPMSDTHPLDHDNYADAINKIEAALDISPQGLFATVAARLAGAYGELTITDNGTPLTLTNQNQWYQISAGWADGEANSHITPDNVGGTLTPSITAIFSTQCALAFISGSLPQTVEFGIFKDGTLVPDHVGFSWTDTDTFPNTVTLVGITPVTAGEAIDVRVRCTTAGALTLTVTDANMNLFMIGV